jgi:hypothetical protein
MRRGNEFTSVLIPSNEGTDMLLWSSRMVHYSPLGRMTCSYVVECGRVNDYKCITVGVVYLIM